MLIKSATWLPFPCNEHTTCNAWLIKLKEGKSVHVDFTIKRCQHTPVTINDKSYLTQTAKYLGMTLEGTCQEKTRRAWTKIQENVLVHAKKIGPVHTL
jgi:D-arabinose 1-dehydrogenase-like Zn-dependent alcohol dehydrogenase